jgi:hypothetical protein
MLVYVDDIVIVGSMLDDVDVLVRSLAVTFHIKDLGRLEYFLDWKPLTIQGDCIDSEEEVCS